MVCSIHQHGSDNHSAQISSGTFLIIADRPAFAATFPLITRLAAPHRISAVLPQRYNKHVKFAICCCSQFKCHNWPATTCWTEWQTCSSHCSRRHFHCHSRRKCSSRDHYFVWSPGKNSNVLLFTPPLLRWPTDRIVQCDSPAGLGADPPLPWRQRPVQDGEVSADPGPIPVLLYSECDVDRSFSGDLPSSHQ